MIGLLLIIIGVILAVTLALVAVGGGPEDPGAVPVEERDLTLILVALIGAVPGTITAVTGLVLALRVGRSAAKPTPTEPSDLV